MLINPYHAINEGWISGIRDLEKQVQPNAIDFTLDKVHQISSTVFRLHTDENGKEQKIMRDMAPVEPEVLDNVSYFVLEPTSCFDGMSDVYVNIPEGVAAMMVIRSTLNRNGVYLVSGLYDSGYNGHIGFVLYNLSKGSAFLEVGSRVGQIMFFPSENAKLYAGGWNHLQGTHYTEATR